MKFVTQDSLVVWLLKLDIINFIFSQAAHKEVINQSKHIFAFLTSKSKIGKKEIDLIWRFQRNKHESIVEAVYQVLYEISNNLSKKNINYLYSKLLSIKPEN